MSYSACDVVQSIHESASDHDIPELPTHGLELLGIEPGDLDPSFDNQDAHNRVIAERIAWVCGDWQAFRTALAGIVAYTESPGAELLGVLDRAREALAASGLLSPPDETP